MTPIRLGEFRDTLGHAVTVTWDPGGDILTLRAGEDSFEFGADARHALLDAVMHAGNVAAIQTAGRMAARRDVPEYPEAHR